MTDLAPLAEAFGLGFLVGSILTYAIVRASIRYLLAQKLLEFAP